MPINNEPTKVVSGGSVPRLHELDGLRSDLELAHRKIDALQEDRRDLERRIKRMALQMLTDELTGLRNRHRFREDLEAAWAYAARQNLLLSLIVLDLDDLQSYNDAFGESAGDQLLRHLAAYLTSGQRAYDMIARFDGGEFALLLPSSDRTDARGVAERLRNGIQEMAWPLRSITASFGVATLESSSVSSAQLLEQSVQALQQAKHEGRNRVTHFVDLQTDSPTRTLETRSRPRHESLVSG